MSEVRPPERGGEGAGGSTSSSSGCTLDYCGKGSRVSVLALVAVAVGITAIVGLCMEEVGAVLGLVGLALGIAARVVIDRNPQRLGGKGYANVGIATGVFALLVFVLTAPFPHKSKELTNRVACAANLQGIARAMIMYSSMYNDRYPYLGPAVVSAKAPTGAVPGGLMNDMYYFVGMGVAAPKQFVCRSDSSAIPAVAPTTAAGVPGYAPPYWSNGDTTPGGNDFSYSYSFAFQYSGPTELGNWWRHTMDSGVAIGADLNPGTKGPWPKGVHNSRTHQNEGQNVVFGDGHAEWFRTPTCGEGGDNIYSVGSKVATDGGCNGMPPFAPLPGPRGSGAFDTCLVPGAVDTSSFRRE
jgi:hypothetical protein